MNLDILKIAVTITLAVIGWIIAHFFTNKRTKDQKRREIVVEHLISAYRILTNEISHREENEERSTELENLISEIQLFGNDEQVNLAKELADTVVKGGTFELDSLINSLRNSLRKELNLSEIKGNVKWLR